MSDLTAAYEQLARGWTHVQLAGHYSDAMRRGEQLPERDQDHLIRRPIAVSWFGLLFVAPLVLVLDEFHVVTRPTGWTCTRRARRRWSSTEEHFERAAALALRGGDRVEIAHTLVWLARARADQGGPSGALAALEDADQFTTGGSAHQRAVAAPEAVTRARELGLI